MKQERVEDWTAEFVALLASWWPDFQFSEDVTVPAWASLFEAHAVTAAEAMRALHTIAASGRDRAPSAGIVLKAIRDGRRGTVECAAETWERIVSGARRAVCPELSTRARKALSSAGGFARVRFANVQSELPWVRKAFIESFEALSEHEERVETLECSARALTLIEGTAARVGIEHKRRA